ncbi:uncharacterized protein LAESUDRAFT_763621 [Laetiporus sulphureus 93-53]|uniref:SUZ domain-containing protein n=1 Tax=Laetiporus sulphureus 93-53 TaxID=1314785 RepID=A0A165BTI8_9APHY|nr:uncharacterized protein LAESUDRAFT_763621 [Laetiporus sulphureus 93-53]KZT01622.1 hypothetical protein LAESUDRAFT_763621 [Laetiporus sulphureus 93-53]
MSLASTSSSTDAWDQPPTASYVPRRPVQPESVPDDWDEDSEDEEDQQKLWEAANNKAPMPELVISASSTAPVVSPPPAAFQPALRILKRPTSSASSSASATPPPPLTESQKSYAEREAQYQAARQRIFRPGNTQGDNYSWSRQEESIAASNAAFGDSSPRGAPGVKVIRNPKGPNASANTDDGGSASGSRTARGFALRGGRGTLRR